MRKLLMLLLAVILLSSCDILMPEEYKVEYVVRGTTNSASVTFENSQGNTSQYSSVALPWEYNFGKADPGTWVYISAQNNENSGTIIVEIFKDGKVWDWGSSSGAYVIADASGTL